MKTHLRITPHSVPPGANVVEIWHDGKLIGTLAGADGPGVRIISKYAVTALAVDDLLTEVRIDPSKAG